MTATVLDAPTNDSFTLSQRLAQGPIDLPDALRYATMLADALRQMHDAGRWYGPLQPSRVLLTAGGMELAAPGDPAAVTPYTAPEILQGRAPDQRSDIFAFGAIFYEVITGRRAFAGDTPDALAVSLTISVPPPVGKPAVDHLIANCLAKDPALRCPRMQKVILELKLITFGALRSEAPSRQQVATAALRAETQQMEARLTDVVEAHEKAITHLQEVTTGALNALREQVSNLTAELAAAHQRAVRAEQKQGEQLQAVAALVQQVEGNVQALDQRAAAGEGKVEVLSQGITMLQEYEASRMHEFEQALRSQSAEIALVSASQVQTDDLVEGVVAAMELLQSSVFDYPEK